MYNCKKCAATFTRSDNLRRHERLSCKKRNEDGSPPAKKEKNDAEPSTSRNVKVIDAQPSTSANVEICNCCNKTVARHEVHSHARTLEHRTNSCVPLRDGVQIIRSAFKCRIASYRIDSENLHLDYVLFFNAVKLKVLNLLEDVIRTHKAVKVNMEAFGRYILQTREVSDIKAFNTSNIILDTGSDLTAAYEVLVDKMVTQSMEFQERDSGWALERILYLEVNVNKYCPIGGSSYLKLPKFIEDKKAVVNVHNEDQYCFAWAITSALYPARYRPNELTSYPHYSSVINVEGMDFPVKLKDISKFEDNNNISINVYGLESKFEDNKIKYEIVGPLHY